MKFKNALPVKVHTRSNDLPRHSESVDMPRWSRDSDAPPDPSLISRQSLDLTTSRELRKACAIILRDLKPSDHDFTELDPLLDFNGSSTHRQLLYRPVDFPLEWKHAQAPKSQRPKTALDGKHRTERPTRTNTDRSGTGYSLQGDSHAKGVVRPQTSANGRTEVDSDDCKSLETSWTNSTVPTSVGLSSKHVSAQGDDAAAMAKSQSLHSSQLPSERPMSRAKSIKKNIKEYVYPGSTAGFSSRPSLESVRSMESHQGSQPKRSGSFRSWKGWGVQRMSSARSARRQETSEAKEFQTEDAEPEVNLNRELPPLPSLDSWKPEEPEQVKPKAQLQGTHIATVMRSQAELSSEVPTAVRRQHRKSRSDGMAHVLVQALPAHATPVQHIAALQHSATTSSELKPRKSEQLDRISSTFTATKNANEHSAPKRRSADPTKISHANRAEYAKPLKAAYSGSTSYRGKSTDKFQILQTQQPDLRYQNIVHISGPASRKEPKRSLTRVISSWVLRKDKKEKEDSTIRNEKKSVRAGNALQSSGGHQSAVR